MDRTVSTYPKINSVYKRDGRGRFTDEFSCPEFDYLSDSDWQWTEKVDGTNIRLYFPPIDAAFRGNEHAYVKGRSDNAQIPPQLLNALVALMQSMPLEKVFTDDVVCLYGEGYGAGIQKGGMYRPDPSFVLFDVRVGEWWLRRESVEEIGASLGVDVVPVVGVFPLMDACRMVQEPSFKSEWEGARPEGLVGRPAVDLWNRKGERIITKVKVKDFR